MTFLKICEIRSHFLTMPMTQVPYIIRSAWSIFNHDYQECEILLINTCASVLRMDYSIKQRNSEARYEMFYYSLSLERPHLYLNSTITITIWFSKMRKGRPISSTDPPSDWRVKTLLNFCLLFIFISSFFSFNKHKNFVNIETLAIFWIVFLVLES